jgi:methanogenic corrinoid protein MtbC1
MNYEAMISELKQLKPVPLNAVHELLEKQEAIIDFVSNKISGPETGLQGKWKKFLKEMNKDQFMHIKFMSQILRFGAFEALLKAQIWLYKIHLQSEMPKDHIINSNKIWIEAIEQTLSPANAESIIQFYKWLVDNHHRLEAVSAASIDEQTDLDQSLNRVREDFLVYLVIGDFCKCLSIASEAVTKADELEKFYLQVLQPCMYEIGYMWQEREITTAQEHLASSMVDRIMSYIYTKVSVYENSKNKAVITTSPGEQHELGARMVSDILEIHGWQVRYLGANTPVESLIELINRENPDILAVSVTMFYNLEDTADLIAEVREECRKKNLKILVGGQAFEMEPGIWKAIGADGYSRDAEQAVDLAAQLLSRSRDSSTS